MSDMIEEKTRNLMDFDPEVLPTELIVEMDRVVEYWKKSGQGIDQSFRGENL